MLMTVEELHRYLEPNQLVNHSYLAEDIDVAIGTADAVGGSH